jgi:hypothetical protein
MMRLVDLITEEIKFDTTFQQAFPKGMNYMSFAAQNYYEHLAEDVKEYCARDVYSEQTFSLYTKLQNFHVFVKPLIRYVIYIVSPLVAV